jgi:uncharacterized protein YsxB (DUF464 family)
VVNWYLQYHQNEDEFVIDIKGHAGYAKRGQDIVCASISTLIYFFVNCVIAIDENSIKHLNLKGGDAKITLNNAKKTRPLLEVFQHSMRDLESQYPQCLKEIESI